MFGMKFRSNQFEVLKMILKFKIRVAQPIPLPFIKSLFQVWCEMINPISYLSFSHKHYFFLFVSVLTDRLGSLIEKYIRLYEMQHCWSKNKSIFLRLENIIYSTSTNSSLLTDLLSFILSKDKCSTRDGIFFSDTLHPRNKLTFPITAAKSFFISS